MNKLNKLNKKQLNILSSSSVDRMIIMNNFAGEMMNESEGQSIDQVEKKATVPVETEFNFNPINWTSNESNFRFAQSKPTVKTEEKLNKAKLARKLFDEMYNESILTGTEMKRSVILKRFVEECELTHNGAATYLQNIKKERGLINSK